MRPEKWPISQTGALDLGRMPKPYPKAQKIRLFRNNRLPTPPVRIEPGLRSQSPKNGNISIIRRRLSANSLPPRPISESGDRQPICKSPPLAGIFESTEGKVSGHWTGWLATQCRSHPSPGKFPANREFNRENCRFSALALDLDAKNRGAAATSRTIPYVN